jgi:tetratricopeptide (TPR) repeat protein
MVLMVALPVSVGGYWAYSRWSVQRSRAFSKQLGVATEELKHDSYASYRKASEAAEQALDVEPDSTAAHGYLAYAYAIRWGEHGGGDDARQKAEEHLAAGKKTGEVSSYLYAGEALLKTYSGKGSEALGELEGRVKAFDAQGKASPLLYLTLGLIQTNAGDLERARDSLERAQALAPDDARIYAALGALYRRRAQDSQAWKNYDFALRYEKNHPASLLGRSLLMLEQEQPNYELAAKMLKTLLEADPPPSPRQLATAHLARSLLVSRVSRELPDYKPEFQQKLSQSTGVPVDKDRARAEVLKSEETGFALDRQNPELSVIKGRRLMGEGQYDAAAAEIRRAIQLDGSRAQYHVELARALMGKPGGEAEAVQALNTALKSMGNSPKLVLMLGDAYRRQGKLAEALAAYDRALLDPKVKNPEARLAMGSVYRERGELPRAQEALDAAKADETFQRALTADESYAPAYFHYAAFLAKEGKQAAKARTTAQEYLKREPKGEFAAEAQRLAE